MAEATNGIQQMAIQMMNPQFAAQQQKFALQQAMAQQMMQQGSEEPPTAQLANPGGMVVQNSPWAALSRAVEKGVGAYAANKAISDQLATFQNMNGQQAADQSPAGQGGAPLLPWQKNASTGMPQGQAVGNAMMGNGMNQPGLAHSLMGLEKYGTAEYEQAQKEQNLTKEAGLKTYTDANNVTHMVSDIMNKGTQPTPQPSVLPPLQSPPMSPDNAAKMDSVYGSGQEALPEKPVVLKGASDEQPNVPMAKDGKPLLPGITDYSKQVGAGPKYNTDITKTGVGTSEALRDADIKDYEKMGTQAENASQMQGRLGYMEDALKSGNAGNIISQNPELANTLIAAGVISDKGAINDVAAFQAYEGAQVQEVINQIKSASPDSPQSRVLAQEFNALSQKMGDPSQRPEAIHQIMAMSQGFADWNKDMVTSYHDMGGLDNRNANKATLRPVDYKIDFAKNHPVYNYIKMARDEIGPFKGMEGNNGEAPAVGFVSKGHKFLGGDPSLPESWSKLP